MKSKNVFYVMMVAILGLVLFTNCKDDKENTTAEKSVERNIVSIVFAGQIGDASINRTTETATVSFEYAGSNLANVEVKSIEISSKATASVSAGDKLNFDNADKTATITVTAENGEELDWKVTLNAFEETLAGTWNIKNMWLYGGYPMWDMSAVFYLNEKKARWNQETGPIAENDNKLVFVLDGMDEQGRTYGTVTHLAGADGLFADFIYTPSNGDGNIYENFDHLDLNSIYRLIPTGEATWVRDYSEKTVTFKFSNGDESVSQFGVAADFNNYEFVEGTEEEPGNTKKPRISGDGGIDQSELVESLMRNHSFYFDVNARKILELPGIGEVSVGAYADGEKFVKNPHFVWVEVERE